ncbi:Bug family tripartite tricarboxylate transporter substrate binding protein [Neorhizobium sp. DT-125]|uniref:Bug family tripartite tricarboxylate transporter substrate binding protein n=1 Tax=Neorhizobium sp. DT-125 TaxID=3396163 RepID=UPI003F1AF2DA
MTTRSKVFSRVAGGLALAGVTLSTSVAMAEWPERPVTLIVVAGAGGGSDYTMRLLGAELEAALGKPFTIVNQAQASGIVGYTTYSNAAKDGYTLGQLSPIAQFKLLGQANFTPETFTAIAQFNADPSAIHVAKDSPFKDMKELVAAIKADPGKLKIHCGGSCNASWDIPFVAMLLDQGVDVTNLNLIPGAGSSAALQELAAGGVDVVLCSIPETTALAQAGVVRTVAVMSEERVAIDTKVPTVKEQLGKSYVGGTWRGIGGPAKMDPALVARIEGSIKKVVDGDKFKKGMEARGFGVAWLNHADFTTFLGKHFDETTKVINALKTK